MAKIILGKTYRFNSASQIVYDVWNRPIELKGEHILVKVSFGIFNDLQDIFHGRSYYIVDNKLVVDVGRGSYIETRCLEELNDENSKTI